MPTIEENLLQVQERIRMAATRADCPPKSIHIVAVSKTKPVGLIREAIAAGILHIGENRVQEAKSKYDQIGSGVTWHLVGHLQRNKVKQALPLFDLIHSVDSLRLLAEIDRHSDKLGQQTDVLIQVNTSGESSKSGISPDDILNFVEGTLAYSNVSVKGLMTIGAFAPNPEDVRPSFIMLRGLQEKIRSQQFPGIEMQYLSMGMTNDFEVAIEEGANLVRIGTAIFGQRDT